MPPVTASSTVAAGLSRRRRRRWVITGAVVVLILAGAATAVRLTRPRPPLPTAVTSQAGFTVYYPTPLVTGSKLATNSVKLTDGILFYKLSYGSQTMTVAEQTVPQRNTPNLSDLPGFNKVSTDAGTAVIGQSPAGLTAIVLNTTTLITLSAPRQLPNDVLAETVQNLHSLTQ